MNFDVVGKVSDGYIVKPQKECEKCYKTEEEEFCPNCDITTSSEILANQNKILIKQTKAPEIFDIETLEDKKSDEVFSCDELMPLNGGINISPILEMGYSYMVEQIRYYEATGELIPWKIAQLLDEAKYMGLSDEETKEFIQGAKEKFVKELEEKKKLVKDEIDTISPTVSSHQVYRVIKDNYEEIPHKYFEKVSNLKKDEEAILNSAPMYVSTSAKKTIQTYGGGMPHNGVLFKINLPEGSKLLKMPSNDGIEQLIMKPDAKFRVVDNQEYKDNFHLIELDYIPEEDC